MLSTLNEQIEDTPKPHKRQDTQTLQDYWENELNELTVKSGFAQIEIVGESSSSFEMRCEINNLVIPPETAKINEKPETATKEVQTQTEISLIKQLLESNEEIINSQSFTEQIKQNIENDHKKRKYVPQRIKNVGV